MVKELKYNYNPQADELNLTFGKVRRAVGIELENEVFIQVDPRTKALVGITVPFFSRRLSAKEQDSSAIKFSGELVAVGLGRI